MITTEHFIEALRDYRIDVVDMRGQLATHPTRRFATRVPSEIEGVVGHHSAGPSGSLDRYKAMARYHVAPSTPGRKNYVSDLGAPGILYTAGISTPGRMGIFHDLDVATWSQGTKAIPGDENKRFLAINVLGNFVGPYNLGEKEPTVDQVHTFTGALLACRDVWGSTFQITGHFALGKPACPGATLQRVIEAVATHVQAKSGFVKTGVGEGGYTYGLRQDGSVEVLAGPTSKGMVFQATGPYAVAHAAVLRELGW